MTGPTGPASQAGQARAWAWVEHLRRGGSTPWAAYHHASETQGPWLPGAIQLEVARRLNAVGGEDTTAHRALVDRVLDSSGPGRGQPDLQLVGAAVESPFGPRPVDPATLPVQELVRMAVGVLAELAVDRDPGPRDPVAPPRPRLLPGGFRLLGDPVHIEQTRAALARAGRRPSRRPRTAVVLADDLGVVLADVWQWRVRQGASASWPAWLGSWTARDELPPYADLARIARRWAERVGSERVHVVVQQHPTAEVGRIVAARGPVDAAHSGLSGHATALLREVNVVLRVLVDAERHRHLLDTVLLPLLAGEHGPPPSLPPRAEAWVRRRAERLRDQLVAGGYSLHGDPERLVPAPRAAAPTDEGVLGVALRALLATRELRRTEHEPTDQHREETR